MAHLNTLERTRNLRSKDRLQKRRERQDKRFEDCDWDSLDLAGKVCKRNIQQPEEHLSHFHLSSKGKKQDKVRRVTAHVFNKNGASLDKYTRREDLNMTSDDDESSNSDKESNSDDDFVVTQYSSSESSWSDFEDNSEGITSCQFYRLFNNPYRIELLGHRLPDIVAVICGSISVINFCFHFSTELFIK